MRLIMTAGQLAAAARAVPGKYAVLVAEGDSHLPVVDNEAMTITVFAQKPEKQKAKPKEPPAAPQPETATEGADA